jgi:hypothetical protein
MCHAFFYHLGIHTTLVDLFAADLKTTAAPTTHLHNTVASSGCS